MLLQINARPDARLAAAATRRLLRPRLLIARSLGWAVIGLALVLQAATGELEIALLLSGLFLAAGIPMFLVNTGTRRAMRGQTTYEVTDGGVSTDMHTYGWRSFSHIETAPGHVLLARRGAGPLSLPTTGLHHTQINQFLATAALHGLPIRQA